MLTCFLADVNSFRVSFLDLDGRCPNPVHKPSGSKLMTWLSHPRVQGTLNIVGGAIKMLASVKLNAYSAGSASVFAATLFSSGIIDIAHGWKIARSNQNLEHPIPQLMQDVGMSQSAAFWTYNIADMAFPLFATKASLVRMMTVAQRTGLPLEVVAQYRYFQSGSFPYSECNTNPLSRTKYTSKTLKQMEPSLRKGYSDFHGFPRIVPVSATYGYLEGFSIFFMLETEKFK
ncbi:MAG: hypothetical protein AAF443_02285 [Chlamydiota bacterium]